MDSDRAKLLFAELDCLLDELKVHRSPEDRLQILKEIGRVIAELDALHRDRCQAVALPKLPPHGHSASA